MDSGAKHSTTMYCNMPAGFPQVPGIPQRDNFVILNVMDDALLQYARRAHVATPGLHFDLHGEQLIGALHHETERGLLNHMLRIIPRNSQVVRVSFFIVTAEYRGGDYFVIKEHAYDAHCIVSLESIEFPGSPAGAAPPTPPAEAEDVGWESSRSVPARKRAKGCFEGKRANTSHI